MIADALVIFSPHFSSHFPPFLHASLGGGSSDGAHEQAYLERPTSRFRSSYLPYVLCAPVSTSRLLDLVWSTTPSSLIQLRSHVNMPVTVNLVTTWYWGPSRAWSAWGLREQTLSWSCPGSEATVYDQSCGFYSHTRLWGSIVPWSCSISHLPSKVARVTLNLSNR